jgi:hypothetical protein
LNSIALRPAFTCGEGRNQRDQSRTLNLKRREFILTAAATALLSPHLARAIFSLEHPPTVGKRYCRYRVFLNDTEIGYHNLCIAKNPDGFACIEHDRRFEVEVLFITAYAFEQKSHEVWNGLTLQELQADSIENGEARSVNGRARGNHFVIDGPEGKLSAPRDLATTESFWGQWALKKPYLLDTVKVKVVRPRVYLRSDGRWQLEHDQVRAAIRFDGSLMSAADVNREGHLIRYVRAGVE